jgi:hypothetical protein
VVVVDFGFADPPPDELQAVPTITMRTRHAKARLPLTRAKLAPASSTTSWTLDPTAPYSVDWADMGSSEGIRRRVRRMRGRAS